MTIPNSDDYIDGKLKEDKGLDLTKLEEGRKKKKEKKAEEGLSESIRKILLYAGFIGATISALAYIIITFVMIKGASTDLAIQNQILFSVMGAVVGILISFLLRSQGIIYAKQNPEAKKVMREYRTESNKTKTLKQLHTITWYVFWASVRDIFLKGITVAVSTWFILYIFIEGSGNWGLFGLAVSNILMFAGFGLVSLSVMYEKYLDSHIPTIIARIERLKEMEILKVEAEEKEKERLLQIEKDKIKIKAKAKAKRKPVAKKKPKKKLKKN